MSTSSTSSAAAAGVVPITTQDSQALLDQLQQDEQELNQLQTLLNTLMKEYQDMAKDMPITSPAMQAVLSKMSDALNGIQTKIETLGADMKKISQELKG